MKTYHFLPVFLVLVAGYIGTHYYAARWLAKAFSLAPAGAAGLRVAFLLAALASPLTMFLKHKYNTPALELLYSAGYSWMGVILIAGFVFFCSDLAAFALRRAGQAALLPWLPKASLAALGVIVLWAIYGGIKTPPVREVEVMVKNLPPSMEGFRIAQISDMHVDSELKLRQFSAIVDRINAEKPDLVLVTGDLIDPGITCNGTLRDQAGRIQSRLGLYGSPGNHEYYFGLDKAMACYKAFGITPLRNEHIDVGDFRLVGLGDIHTEHMTEADVAKILARAGGGKFTIVMSHQPVFYKAIAAAGDFLVLSGHTHRGQIFPFNIFTKLFYPYFFGLYHIKDTVFYVTSGNGTWGPPLRWLAPSEIPVLILKNAS
jgi:predicted MPP superfamily phosphohydrolase